MLSRIAVPLFSVLAISAQRYLTKEEMAADPFHDRGFTIQGDPDCNDVAGGGFMSLKHDGELTTHTDGGHCERFKFQIASYNESLPEGSGGPYTYSIQGDCGQEFYLGINHAGEIQLGTDRWPDHCQWFTIEQHANYTDRYSFKSVCYSGRFLTMVDGKVDAYPHLSKCETFQLGLVEIDFDIMGPEMDDLILHRTVSFQAVCGEGKYFLGLKDDGKTPYAAQEITDCERFEVETRMTTDDEEHDDKHAYYALRSKCGERRYLSISHEHEVTTNDVRDHCEGIMITNAYRGGKGIYTLVGDCGSHYIPKISIQHDGTVAAIEDSGHCEGFRMIVAPDPEFVLSDSPTPASNHTPDLTFVPSAMPTPVPNHGSFVELSNGTFVPSGQPGRIQLTEDEIENDPFHMKGFTLQANPGCDGRPFEATEKNEGGKYVSISHEKVLGSSDVAGKCETFGVQIASRSPSSETGFTYSLRGTCGGYWFLGFDQDGEISLGFGGLPGAAQEFLIYSYDAINGVTGDEANDLYILMTVEGDNMLSMQLGEVLAESLVQYINPDDDLAACDVFRFRPATFPEVFDFRKPSDRSTPAPGGMVETSAPTTHKEFTCGDRKRMSFDQFKMVCGKAQEKTTCKEALCKFKKGKRGAEDKCFASPAKIKCNKLGSDGFACCEFPGCKFKNGKCTGKGRWPEVFSSESSEVSSSDSSE